MAFEIKENQVLFQHNTGDIGKKPVYSVQFNVLGKTVEFGLWPAKSGKAGSYSGTIKIGASAKPEPQPAVLDALDDAIGF